jgi:hypothetical protein
MEELVSPISEFAIDASVDSGELVAADAASVVAVPGVT